ncbi:MAG: hypothetical protein PVI67_05410 [Anaerolineae bacterium]|jgi:hypothetical protein
MAEFNEENREQLQTEASPKAKLGRADLLDRWTEILSAIMLGLVAMATAWSGYQSARWGGVQSTKYSEAGALRVESTRASALAGQQTQIDVGLFSNWLNAYADENLPLEEFYRERFRAEFMPAFSAWLATRPVQNPEAPSSPFDMPEYQLAATQQAEDLEQQASATFDEGKAANQLSDDYILNAVILASVLFLAGIAPRFDWLPVRVVIIVVAFLLLVLGAYNLATYPIN